MFNSKSLVVALSKPFYERALLVHNFVVGLYHKHHQYRVDILVKVKCQSYSDTRWRIKTFFFQGIYQEEREMITMEESTFKRIKKKFILKKGQSNIRSSRQCGVLGKSLLYAILPYIARVCSMT